jgi:hypothetical protein
MAGGSPILFWPKIRSKHESAPEGGRQGRLMVSRIDRFAGWMAGAAVALAVIPAQAQSTNIDAGKSAAQIFADTCNGCHRSPRQLRPTTAWFLRDHYTTGGREAAAMAAYLASMGSDPRAVQQQQQRRPPAVGAGQATSPPATEAGRSPETQAALPTTAPGRRAPAPSENASPSSVPSAAVKPRRPSESAEAGNLPVDAAQTRAADASTPHAPAATPTQTLEEFEE